MPAVATRSRAKQNDSSTLLEPADVMRRLNIKKTHLYALMKRGELAYIEMSSRCRRFEPSAVEAFIHKRVKN